MSITGRPTDYKEEYNLEAEKYLQECEDQWTEFHKTRGEKSDTYERIVKVKLPSIEGLSLRLNVSEKTMYNWAEKHETFLQSLRKIKREQKKRLMEEGLAGNYNPTIAKLILSANHGMREGQDITSDGKQISNYDPEQIKRTASEILRDGSEG